jgi:hypothetical protein
MIPVKVSKNPKVPGDLLCTQMYYKKQKNCTADSILHQRAGLFQKDVLVSPKFKVTLPPRNESIVTLPFVARCAQKSKMIQDSSTYCRAESRPVERDRQREKLGEK